MSSYVDALKRWEEDSLSAGQAGTEDSYRLLRARLEAKSRGLPLKGIVFAGVDRGDDAHRVGRAYATSLVSAHRHVLLVDADLRTAAERRAYAGAVVGADFASLVGAGRSPAEPSGAGLQIVAATAVANPDEVLAHPACAEWIRAQRERFGFVVVTAPPVLLWADAVPLGNAAGGVVLVTRERPGYEAAAAHADAILAAAGCRTFGVVLHGR